LFVGEADRSRKEGGRGRSKKNRCEGNGEGFGGTFTVGTGCPDWGVVGAPSIRVIEKENMAQKAL